MTELSALREVAQRLKAQNESLVKENETLKEELKTMHLRLASRPL